MGVELPILQNHDHTRPIGRWEAGGIGEIFPGVNITVDQLFAIFGGAGVKILAHEIVLDAFTGKYSTYVRRFEILEFSLCPTPPALPAT